MINISYIRLLGQIESFCEAHMQINRFASDFQEQLPNFGTETEGYPILYVTPTSSVFDQNTNSFTVDIYCFDIIQKDRANINTILSDTNQILNDLHKWFLDDNVFGVDIQVNNSVTPINNSLLDYAAGWVMTATFIVDTYGSCEIPFSGSPTVITEVNDIIYSRYLTCETLDSCDVIQDIQDAIDQIEIEISNLSGGTDTFVTGGTYNPTLNRFTFTNNTGGTFTVSGNVLTQTSFDAYIGQRLTPTDTNSNGFAITKNTNTEIGLKVKNTSTTGNGATANIGVGGDGTVYENGLSMIFFGKNYYIPYLRNTGGIYSTNDLNFINTNNSKIDFRTGNAFGSETSKFSISSGGTLSIGVRPVFDSTDDLLARKSDGSIVITSKSGLTSGFTANYVPYTGATSDLDLGSNNLYANQIFLNGVSTSDGSSTSILNGGYFVIYPSDGGIITNNGYPIWVVASGDTTSIMGPTSFSLENTDGTRTSLFEYGIVRDNFITSDITTFNFPIKPSGYTSTFAMVDDLVDGYVPYSGATSDVNLGLNGLLAGNGIQVKTSTGSMFNQFEFGTVYGSEPFRQLKFKNYGYAGGAWDVNRIVNIEADIENGIYFGMNDTDFQRNITIRPDVLSLNAIDNVSFENNFLSITPTEVSTNKSMIAAEGFKVSPFLGNVDNIFELGTNYINENYRQITFTNIGDGIDFPTEKSISINVNIEEGIGFSLTDTGDSYGQFNLGPSTLSINIGQSGIGNSIDVSNIQTQFGKKVVTQEGFEGNYVQFNTAATETSAVGKMIWNDQDGTLDLGLKGGNVVLQVGLEQLVRVVNKAGENLLESAYQAVRVTGAQGNRLKVDLALATDDLNSAETIGIVTETILDNQEGFVTTNGLVRNINTTGSIQGETWNDGDILYLSPVTAGGLTNIKPIAPQHLVVIGYVVRAHITQGSIYVKVNNGYELDELHNVKLTGATNSQILTYNEGLGVWENKDQILVQTQRMFNTYRATTNSIVAIGNTVGYNLGAGQTARVLTGDAYERQQRIGVVSTSGTSQVTSYRNASLHFTLDGLEYFEQTFGNAEGMTDSATRAVHGIFTDVGVLSGNIEYTSLLNVIGVCKLSTSTNWHVIHNDNAGVATAIDLGSNFPSNVTKEKFTYRITPVSSNNVNVTFTRHSTGVSTTVNINSNMPSTAVLMTGKGALNTNTSTNAVGFDFFAVTELFK